MCISVETSIRVHGDTLISLELYRSCPAASEVLQVGASS